MVLALLASVVSFVDPFIGTKGVGHCYPGAAYPFGLVQASPDTGEEVSDVTGLIGNYAHGNEPSHHIAWFYVCLGRKDLAEKRIREICERFYRPTPDGLCGNDDCGQMSAWYIFACLGFYPFDPCGGEYLRIKPLVNAKITLHPTP